MKNVHIHRERDRQTEVWDRIGVGGGEANKRKKPKETCRHYVGNGVDLGGK